MGGCEWNLSDLGQGQSVGFCVQGNELSGSIKWWEFID